MCACVFECVVCTLCHSFSHILVCTQFWHSWYCGSLPPPPCSEWYAICCECYTNMITAKFMMNVWVCIAFKCMCMVCVQTKCTVDQEIFTAKITSRLHEANHENLHMIKNIYAASRTSVCAHPYLPRWRFDWWLLLTTTALQPTIPGSPNNW